MFKLILAVIVGAVLNSVVYKLLGLDLEWLQAVIYTTSSMLFGALIYRSFP